MLDVVLCRVCGCEPQLNTDFDELDSQPAPARSNKTQNHSEAARRLYCVLCCVQWAVLCTAQTINHIKLLQTLPSNNGLNNIKQEFTL